MQGLPVILKRHNLQSLDKAFDLFIESKFCESDFYFLNGSKNCIVATYNFGSVYDRFFNLMSQIVLNTPISHLIQKTPEEERNK